MLAVARMLIEVALGFATRMLGRRSGQFPIGGKRGVRSIVRTCWECAATRGPRKQATMNYIVRDRTSTLGQAAEDGPASRIGERPERDAERVIIDNDGAGHAVVRVSSIMPDGGVRLSVATNWLVAAPLNSFRPSPSTIGQEEQPVFVDEPCGAEGFGELPAAVDDETLAPRPEVLDRVDADITRRSDQGLVMSLRVRRSTIESQ